MTVGTLPSAWTPRFLYDWLVQNARSPVEQGLKIFLYGGPGTGKTSVAERLASGLDAMWIHGRDYGADPGAATEDLERALKHEGVVVVDDVDLIYPAAAVPVGNLVRNKRGLVLTTSLPLELNVHFECRLFPGWDQTLTTDWSRFSQWLEPHYVDPWEKGWQRFIANTLRSIIGEGPETENAVAAWWTIVVHLTGGHPVMLNEAFAAIWREQSSHADNGTEDDVREWRQQYARMEEHLHGSGLRRMRHAVHWLQQNYPGARSVLTELALGKPAAELGPMVRSILTDSGLAHRGHAEGMVVSGAVLKQYVAGEPIATEPSISVVRSGTDENAGSIVINVADTSIAVPVSGTVWRIAEELNRSRGAAMGIEDLKKKLALEKSGGLRSALQRLRDDLRDLGVEGVIDNVRGTGYRLGTFPILHYGRRKA